eukprot:NODE_365_length_10088_cov_0.583041.p1 type:complete len:557 gc:universal NODE_365_length_10088_cov_0.583041:7990-9660(+)
MILICFLITATLEKSERIFNHALDGYLKYAYPADELDPLNCTSKDPKMGIDIMGNYTLSLIDSLTTALTMRQPLRFIELMNLLIIPDFDLNSTVSVFEVTIRVLGALTSSALLLKDSHFLNWLSDDATIISTIVDFYPKLHYLSLDLGGRLLKAFDTITGIPASKINLRHGIPTYNRTNLIYSHNLHKSYRITNPASASTLLLEFGMLSELTNNLTYYNYAKRAVFAAFNTRSKIGLFGNEINIDGKVIDHHHSLGGGIDSLYEYLFKGYLIFNDESFLDLFLISYQQLMTFNAYTSSSKYYFKHNKQCFRVDVPSSFHLSVHKDSSRILIPRISGLAAFFPGLQILLGDSNQAFYHLLVYIRLLEIYPFVPEAFNLNSNNVEFNMYLLRPEVFESMVFIGSAFKDSLPVLRSLMTESIDRLNYYCKTSCGYASLSNLIMATKEPRMESYFLSETAKYMYLMFNQNHMFLGINYTFTTEGHPVRILNWSKQKSMYPMFNITDQRVLKIKRTKQCLLATDPYQHLTHATFKSFDKYITDKKIKRLIRRAYKKVLFNF